MIWELWRPEKRWVWHLKLKSIELKEQTLNVNKGWKLTAFIPDHWPVLEPGVVASFFHPPTQLFHV